MTDEVAAVLREAAALMRSRAQAATPGPWGVWSESGWDGTADGDEAKIQDDSTDMQISIQSPHTFTDARHVASWHPAVALAVADWLDFAANRQDVGGDFWTDDAAHAVATAYLGTAEVTS